MKPPKRIDAILPEVMQKARRQHTALFAVRRKWRSLVGKELAVHTKPVSLRQGRLIVCADNPGDSFALSFKREKLIQRLRETTELRVEEIVIRAGQGGSEGK